MALAGPGLPSPARAATAADVLGTMHLGTYVCEVGGDALGHPHHVPGADFTILRSSAYAVGRAQGSYLFTGDLMVMTSGPHRGERYRRISDNFLRKLKPDGSDDDIRCIRQVLNNR